MISGAESTLDLLAKIPGTKDDPLHCSRSQGIEKVCQDWFAADLEECLWSVDYNRAKASTQPANKNRCFANWLGAICIQSPFPIGFNMR